MELQLTIITLEGLHFDDGCLFEVIQTKLLALELCHILNHSGQCVDQVHDVVTLIENNVDVLASCGELRVQAPFDHILHQVWVRLVTNFENVVFVNFAESCCCRLQIVQSISHVTFGSENNGFVTLILAVEFLLVNDCLESLEHFLIGEFGKPNDSAPTLNRLN